MHLRTLLPSQAHNLRTLREQPLSEISGSLGDLGTLLPLLLALTLTGSISLPTTLVFTGLSNILTGLFFSIPVPVQPMKAIAAVAIANNFSITETTSAGLFVGGVILFASITGLLGTVGRIVPIPVVKGIQVGAGLTLAISGGTTILSTTNWWKGDSRLLAFFAFLVLVLTTRPLPMGSKKSPRIPCALLITMIGIVVGIASVSTSTSEELPFFFHPWRPKTYIPTPQDFKKGALTAGLGQLPLTILNSIIAVTYLSSSLLPSPPNPPAPGFTALGLSVGLMNLVGCWFGAMPVCHGSGGLAGQPKFGARSGSSIIFLGVVKLVLGCVVSERWLTAVLGGFPKSLLGVMVLGAGLELARVGESINDPSARDLHNESGNGSGEGSAAMVDDGSIPATGEGEAKKVRQLNETERTQRYYVMLVTVALLLAFKNDAVGFVAGMVTHWAINAPRYWVRVLGYWNRVDSRWRGRGRSRRNVGGGDANERTGLLAA